MKRFKLALIILLAFGCTVLTSCDTRDQRNVDFSGMHFKCIEENLDGTYLFMHEETGVLYAHMCQGICPIIKDDGTAYTIEDYEKNLKWKGDLNEEFYSK